MTRTPKIIFILSSTRSGSTWLGYVLGSTQNAAFLGEYYRAWEPNLGVPCSWCAANGDAVCPVLDGLGNVPAEEAFAFAFARVRRPVLVDSSKSLSWTGKFVGKDSRYEICLIHLVRDPRGWYSSERRRHCLDPPVYLSRWIQQQRDISSFMKQSEVASTTVFYDELATSPILEVAELCAVLNLPFTSECLNYWRQPQHGFAANGASSFLFSGRRDSSSVVVTGDDDYYRAHREQFFVDERWKSALTPEESGAIENHPDIIELFGSYGRTLSPEGISRVSIGTANARVPPCPQLGSCNRIEDAVIL